MNIVIGKFGRSVMFNESNWGAIGGDNEPAIFYKNLAEYNPDITFYMIGKSDISRYKGTISIPTNIIDCWIDYDKKKDDYTYIEQYFKKNNIHIDGGIIMSGLISSVNIPNRIYKTRDKSTKEFAKPLETFANYAAPMVHYLNDSQIPYLVISPDPRYISLGRDCFNVPVKSLSQFKGTFKYNHIIDYINQNQVKSDIKTDYNSIETTFLIDKKKQDIKTKTKKMMIVLNEGGNGGLLRGPMLKEYVLNYINDVEIYGKWSDEWMTDNRFKGPKKFIELQPLLEEVKYSFIIPIDKGWTTAKIWEMIHYNIIPFMHPYYDSQRNLDSLGLPDFIRVKNPKDLYDKINMLENDESLYEELLNQCKSMLKDSFYNGSYLNNVVMSEFYNEILHETYINKTAKDKVKLVVDNVTNKSIFDLM